MIDTGRVCGFIGLGSQGAPIAKRLMESGYPVVLWARRAETLTPFRGTSASFAESIRELSARVNHVGVCVVGDEGVVDVTEALIENMNPGGTIAIHSTVLPETCQTLAIKAEKRRISLLDAPVSGGEPAADQGKLTIMVGGRTEVLTDLRPVFETFGSLIVHLGDVGAGQQAKLINNSLMIANMGLAHSAINAGVANGLNREELIQLLGASSAQSFGLDVYARNQEPQGFDRLQTLMEKVDLLGKVIGTDHPTYKLLREAVKPLEN